MYTTLEIAQELISFNSPSERIEDHMIFYTEDDDHETFKDMFLTPRLGLESIERKRWGQKQQKHGKMTRKRGSGTKYTRKESLSTDGGYKPLNDDIYNYLLFEELPDILDIEGNPVEAEKPSEAETTVWKEELGSWYQETKPIYGIFSTTFSITGDYNHETYQKLEAILFFMRGRTAQQKLDWVKENLPDIDLEVKFK